jgi:PncC family amidohydrolase
MYSIKTIINQHKLSIGAVESVTGGLISDYFVQMPGASSFFVGSLVTYQLLAKEIMLGFSKEELDKGVVSESFIKRMVNKGLEKIPCDIILASSGNAGPTFLDHSQDGEIHLAVGNKNVIMTKKLVLEGTRQFRRRTAVSEVIHLLKDFITTYY